MASLSIVVYLVHTLCSLMLPLQAWHALSYTWHWFADVREKRAIWSEATWSFLRGAQAVTQALREWGTERSHNIAGVSFKLGRLLVGKHIWDWSAHWFLRRQWHGNFLPEILPLLLQSTITIGTRSYVPLGRANSLRRSHYGWDYLAKSTSDLSNMSASCQWHSSEWPQQAQLCLWKGWDSLGYLAHHKQITLQRKSLATWRYLISSAAKMGGGK